VATCLTCTVTVLTGTKRLLVPVSDIETLVLSVACVGPRPQLSGHAASETASQFSLTTYERLSKEAHDAFGLSHEPLPGKLLPGNGMGNPIAING